MHGCANRRCELIYGDRVVGDKNSGQKGTLWSDMFAAQAVGGFEAHKCRNASGAPHSQCVDGHSVRTRRVRVDTHALRSTPRRFL